MESVEKTERRRTTVLRLQPGVHYGPVRSRRFGRSLGVNLMPAEHKLCTFDCVYCQYGATGRSTVDVDGLGLPTPAHVLASVEQIARGHLAFDAITFSGNGEPTLHPDFGEIVAGVVEIRDRFRPRTRLALLSNGTGLELDEVWDSIPSFDTPVFKLDAGTEETFRDVNRPISAVEFEELVNTLACLRGISLQTMLIDGSPYNTDDAEICAWYEKVKEIRPREVQLYSIDRPTCSRTIRRVPRPRLRAIAELGERATGVPFRVFAA